MVISAEGAVQAVYLLQSTGHPDLATVELVARLKLSAARMGGDIVLDAPTLALRQLLDLAGLAVEIRGELEHPGPPA